MLPVEFSRISQDDRLTLVIHPGSEDQVTLWALSACATLQDAREELRNREKTSSDNIHSLDRDGRLEGAPPPHIVHSVSEWLAQHQDVQAVLWTGLRSNWEKKKGCVFTVDRAVNHLLELESKANVFKPAREYVTRAPSSINTPVRRAMRAHGWDDIATTEGELRMSTSEMARISINLETGLIEISGSEDFVKEQMGSLKPAIESLLARPSASGKESRPAAGSLSAGRPGGVSPSVEFPNVYSAEGDTVSVMVGDIPGEGKKPKTQHLAVLYLYGKDRTGKTKVPFDEIRTICRDHGCLDESNFAANLKDAKKWIVVIKDGASMMAHLTPKGVAKAHELAKELNSA